MPSATKRDLKKSAVDSEGHHMASTPPPKKNKIDAHFVWYVYTLQEGTSEMRTCVEIE